MILTTTEFIKDKDYYTLGLVQGAVVQSKHVGKDIGASFKTLVGGEIVSYTQMMNEARDIATQRMIAQASQMGADAIVCVRYSSAAIMQGAAEIFVTGTAVKFK